VTYGPGRMKRIRQNMRTATAVRLEDKRDIGGIVARAEEALGFGDPRAMPGTPERMQWLALTWFQRAA